jgi:hypothetical protein
MEESTKMATQGQIKEIHKLALDAVPGDLSFDNAENILTSSQFLQELKSVYNNYVTGDNKKKENQNLKLISQGKELTINAVDGKETLYEAKEVFKSGIDSDLKGWGLNKKGSATPETPVEVHEMIKDATFSKIFSSFGTDLNKLCLTQAQIKNFCIKYPTWLRQDGYGTFFLFKENEQYFVADVYVNSDGLFVDVRRLEFDDVWYADYLHRIVVPQQAVEA